MFTQEQVLEMANSIAELQGMRDSDLENALVPLEGNEYLTVVQDGMNKKVSIFNLPSGSGSAYGTTAERPTLQADPAHVGYQYLDRTLHKLITWDGSVWREADGAVAGALRYGTTAQRPSSSDIYNGFAYLDNTIAKQIFWTDTRWIEGDGATADTLRLGTTANRPTSGIYVGFQYFDTDLNKLVIWNGSVWKTDI